MDKNNIKKFGNVLNTSFSNWENDKLSRFQEKKHQLIAPYFSINYPLFLADLNEDEEKIYAYVKEHGSAFPEDVDEVSSKFIYLLRNWSQQLAVNLKSHPVTKTDYDSVFENIFTLIKVYFTTKKNIADFLSSNKCFAHSDDNFAFIFFNNDGFMEVSKKKPNNTACASLNLINRDSSSVALEVSFWDNLSKEILERDILIRPLKSNFHDFIPMVLQKTI